MKIVTDHGFPKAATAESSFDEAFAAFKNERDYINQSGRMGMTVAAMDWAAATLDSLTAKVEELEAEVDERDSWILAAQGQRDEAVTTTRYKIFDNLLGAYIGADNETLRIAIGNLAFMIFPEHRDTLCKTAEERRLASGPEGGGKPQESKP